MTWNSTTWKKLSETKVDDDKLVARIAIPENNKDLLAALDSSGIRHFLIAVNDSEEELNDTASRGLHVKTRLLQIQGYDEKRYIDIICLDESAHNVFDLLGEEISTKLSARSSGDTVKKIVDKWRKFWTRDLKNLLTHEEIVGLVSELWFLNYWIVPRMGIGPALEKWKGPSGERHDFVFENESIEVKGTTSVNGRRHKINGLDQLKLPDSGRLFLFSLRMREESGANVTLNSMVDVTRELSANDGVAKSSFETALGQMGYLDQHREAYDKICFRVIDEKLFSVTSDFPKITVDDFSNGVPAGVGKVEYMIILDGFDNLCVAKKAIEFEKVFELKL